MQSKHYTKTINVDQFVLELLAALPTLAPTAIDATHATVPYSLFPDTAAAVTTGITLVIPDDVSQGTVDSVVAAHSSVIQSPAQQTATADVTNLNDLTTQYTVMVNALDSMQTDMDTLKNHATTLSTITIGNLAAAQSAFRSLGSDLSTLVDDVKALTVGSERVLKVARTLVRRMS